MVQIYKVFDDEWKQIMGEEQIREFALSQVQDNSDDFTEESINQVEGNDKARLIELANKILNERNFMPSNLTEKDVGLILTERCFDVVRLNIY